MKERLAAYVHAHIPLSQAMEVSVLEASPATVRVGCPLGPNVNHRGSAFGGSIASLATLAGWGWVWVVLEAYRRPVTIVVARSEVDYLAPGLGDFEAAVEELDASEVATFLAAFERKGRARIAIWVRVRDGETEIARLRGWFVANAGHDAR